MTEKNSELSREKKPRGVIVFVIIYILLSLPYLGAFLLNFLTIVTGDLSNQVLIFNDYRSNYLFVYFCVSLLGFKGFFYLFGALLITKRKRWGYRAAFASLLVPILFYIEIPMLIAHIIFFTRPGVRKKFS